MGLKFINYLSCMSREIPEEKKFGSGGMREWLKLNVEKNPPEEPYSS